jgi:TonB family protein
MHFRKIVTHSVLVPMVLLMSAQSLAQNDSVTIANTATPTTVVIESQYKKLYPTAQYAFNWDSFVEHQLALHYPPKAKRKGIQGDVTVKFRITKQGKHRFLRIISKRLGHGLEKRAKQIVKLSKGGWWVPENAKGEAIPQSVITSIRFRLP